MNKLLLAILLLELNLNFLNAQYLRDEDNNVVFDTSTMLIWEDSSGTTADVKDAFEYCKTLTIGNYYDWRVPSYNELYSIVDLTKSRPALNGIFEEWTLGYYWTSSLNIYNTPWAIDFTTGANHSNISPVSQNKVRCVHNFF